MAQRGIGHTPKTEGAVEPSTLHADMQPQTDLPILWASVSPSIYGSVAKTFPLLERMKRACVHVSLPTQKATSRSSWDCPVRASESKGQYAGRGSFMTREGTVKGSTPEEAKELEQVCQVSSFFDGPQG